MDTQVRLVFLLVVAVLADIEILIAPKLLVVEEVPNQV